MSPTLVSKKISELFKKPKKWNAYLVGIVEKVFYQTEMINMYFEKENVWLNVNL